MSLPVGQRAPHLAVETFDGQVWSLHEQRGTRGDLVFFYLDLDGPPSIDELAERVGDFERIAIAVTAVIPHARKKSRSVSGRKLPNKFRIGYDPLRVSHRDWGIPVPDLPSVHNQRSPPIGVYLVSPSGEILISNCNIGHLWRLDLGRLLDNTSRMISTTSAEPATTRLLDVKLTFPGGRGARPIRSGS